MLLNFDVLIIIAWHLDKTSLLRFMRTCKALYASCATNLIRRPHSLNDHNISYFCRFILADPRRGEQLRILRFDDPHPTLSWEHSDAARLTRVLSGAPYIHTLRIMNCTFFFRHADVSQAIARMTNLRHFTLRVPDDTTFQLLKQMRSPLVTIDVGHPSTNPSRVDLTCFRTFQSSLEAFKVHSFAMVDTGATYENLQTLHLDNESVDISRMVTAFPNLHSLSLSKLAPLHPRNLLSRRFLNRESLSHDSWTKLSFVEGNVPVVHSLGLSCSVRHIAGHVYSSSDYWLLDEIVQDVRPDTLTIFLRVPSSVTSLNHLIPHVAPTLQHLTLNFTLLPDSVYYDDVVFRLARQIRNHPITTCSFNFCYAPDGKHQDRMAALASLGGRRIIEELFRTLRTLKTASVGFPCWQGQDYHQSYWVAAAEKGGSPTLDRVVHESNWRTATANSPFDHL